MGAEAPIPATLELERFKKENYVVRYSEGQDLQINRNIIKASMFGLTAQQIVPTINMANATIETVLRP